MRAEATTASRFDNVRILGTEITDYSAAFADATKLTAPIKPRRTKRILKLLYRYLPAVRYATAFILFPIQLQGSIGNRISRKERNGTFTTARYIQSVPALGRSAVAA